MRKLQKLAIILRAMGVRTKIFSEPITFGDGTKIDNTFLSAEYGKCVWNIWDEDPRYFEVHLYYKKECVYDSVCHSKIFDVVAQITTDHDKFNVHNKPFVLA